MTAVDHKKECRKLKYRRSECDCGLVAGCEHPISKAEVTSHTIMNCPQEGWPDEEVNAVRCGHCGEVTAVGTQGVLEVLLGHVKRLSAEVEELRKENGA